jgi:hypothetical protein
MYMLKNGKKAKMAPRFRNQRVAEYVAISLQTGYNQRGSPVGNQNRFDFLEGVGGYGDIPPVCSGGEQGV